MNAPHASRLLANPLLDDWTAQHGLPPFDRIRAVHFVPAFAVALKAHREEIDAIAGAEASPCFDNTVAAFDRSGRLVTRIRQVLSNLTASASAAELQAVERELAAPLAAHGNAIYLHAGLFARIDTPRTRGARRSGSTPSSCACSSASTSISSARAQSFPARRRSATPR